MSLINIQTPNVTGKKYWRSLNQLADTAEFREWVHREFPANATEMLEGGSRRTVLKGLVATTVGVTTGAAVYGSRYERHQLTLIRRRHEHPPALRAVLDRVIQQVRPDLVQLPR